MRLSFWQKSPNSGKPLQISETIFSSVTASPVLGKRSWSWVCTVANKNSQSHENQRTVQRGNYQRTMLFHSRIPCRLPNLLLAREPLNLKVLLRQCKNVMTTFGVLTDCLVYPALVHLLYLPRLKSWMAILCTIQQCQKSMMQTWCTLKRTCPTQCHCSRLWWMERLWRKKVLPWRSIAKNAYGERRKKVREPDWKSQWRKSEEKRKRERRNAAAPVNQIQIREATAHNYLIWTAAFRCISRPAIPPCQKQCRSILQTASPMIIVFLLIWDSKMITTCPPRQYYQIMGSFSHRKRHSLTQQCHIQCTHPVRSCFQRVKAFTLRPLHIPSLLRHELGKWGARKRSRTTCPAWTSRAQTPIT